MNPGAKDEKLPSQMKDKGAKMKNRKYLVGALGLQVMQVRHSGEQKATSALLLRTASPKASDSVQLQTEDIELLLF